MNRHPTERQIEDFRAMRKTAIKDVADHVLKAGIKPHPRVAKLKTAALALAATMALTGCSTTSGTIPPSLLSCAPQPPAPHGGDQRAAALYVLDLASAGEDCRSKLGSARRLQSE